VARQFAPLRLVPTERQAAPKPVGKKLWASLQKPMKMVIETACAEGLRRDPQQQAEWVVLVDGDPTQLAYIKKAAKAHGVRVVIILDIIHALEYLWKAAKVRFAPDDPQAAPWVAEQIEGLLHGQVTAIVRSLRGSVANFVQEVLKGQLPSSVRGLRGQGVELFGRTAALLNSVFKLPFSQHVHQFDAGEGGLRCVERFEPQHRPCHPLHSAMILFHDVV
jgi:hypothetical protein